MKQEKSYGINERIFKPLSPVKNHIKVFGYDVETSNNNRNYILGCLYSKDFQKFFYSAEDAKNFFNTNNMIRNQIVFATNLLFDFFATWKKEEINPELIRIVMPKSNLISCTVTQNFRNGRPNDRVKFYDTMNFSHSSVKELGKVVGCPKLEKPDFLGRKPRNIKEWDYLKEYNLNDAKITYLYAQTLADFCAENKSRLRATVAGTSMDLYRRKYMKTAMLLPNDFEAARMGYYGGRTEAYFRGTFPGKMFAYDINSMYAWAMLGEYPDTWSLKTDVNNKDALQYQGVSDVTMQAPYMFYPFLPFKYGKKLFFPYGKIKGYYTNIEINKALELGYKILEIRKQYFYTRTYYPFKEFVTKLYKKRMEANSLSEKLFYKTIINGLYGKWAQGKMEYLEYKPLEFCTAKEALLYSGNYTAFAADTDKELKRLENEYKEFCLIPRTSDYPKFYNPIFSIITTARARIKLYDYLEKYKAVYCDTDCCFTAKQMPTSDKIGSMKLEYSGECTIVRPKMYKFKELKFRAKGFSLNKESSWDKLLRSGKLSQMKFIRLKEAWRTGKTVNEKYRFSKHADIEDDKREWPGKFNKKEWQESQPYEIK